MFADEDDEDDDGEEERDISFKNSEEFVLPLHEFDHLVPDIVREPSRNPSPSPIRTTRAHREGSQTPSVADSSRASSPEEDDGMPSRGQPPLCSCFFLIVAHYSSRKQF